MNRHSSSRNPRTGAEAAPPDPVSAAPLWAAALDQFERRMHEFAAVLDGDGRPPSELWPPAHLIDIPLPAEHADRARSLLEQARAVEGRLTERRDQLPTPGPATRHHHRPTRPHYSFQADL